ncbi:MAG TPA: hypothetical protein VFW95_10270 [Candidatus Limnocylindria bacterium]|nr:hypothetical protein [Candidatus Limnocylindria bacterium]
MSGALTWARLSFRLQRLEILLLGIAVLAASGLMLWWASQLVGLAQAYPTCDFFDPGLACRAAGERFSQTFSTAEIIIRNTWLAGFAVGLLLGVPLVAREIDHGTAQLAWSMSRSRLRWLIRRIAFPVLVALVLASALAITTEVLAAAMLRDTDLSQDFNLYGNRGPLTIGRTMLGLGAGVFVGAVLGRQLPALLLGLVLIAGLYAASAVALPAWYRTEAEIASMDEFLGGPLWLDSGIELTSGELVSWGEFYGGSVQATETYQTQDGTYYASQADADAGRDPIGRDYVLIIPGERYNEIVARETAVWIATGLVLVAGAALVVQRRRPT